MILWSSKPTPPLMHCERIRSWRWALLVEWDGVTIERQMRCDGEEWKPCGEYAAVSIGKPFTFGQCHMYYDGPHCVYSLGVVHFERSWGHCEKCYPEPSK